MSTRPRILAAADRLYRAGGLAALSTGALAREAGTSKRALYEHFAHRDAIVEALLTERLDRLAAELDAVVASELPMPAKIRRFAEAVAILPAELPPGFLTELQRHAPEVAASLRDKRRSTSQASLRRLLELGVAAGEVRADVPVPLLVAVSEVVMENVLGVEPPPGHGLLDVAQAALQVVLQGILARPGGSLAPL